MLSANTELRYEGDLVDGKPHGEGRLFYSDDALFYRGMFKNGKPHGQGALFYSSGNLMYKGEFANGKPHGRGALFYENGKPEYKGELANGKPHGEGCQYNPNGRKVYEGRLKNSKAHGKGCGYNRNGELSYKGTYRDGKAHGWGEMYDEDGKLRQEGEYVNGERWGKGRNFYPNGKTMYEGDFKSSEAHGQGKQYDENGMLQYEGAFASGKRDGQGSSFYPEGGVEYEGAWKEGKPGGKGRLYDTNGLLKYEGDHEGGLSHGEGTMFYPNGTPKYKGMLQKGEAHGEGCSFYPSGKKLYEGMWDMGHYTGKGRTYYSDGTLWYDGMFKEGKYDGMGMFYRTDKTLQYEGEFVQSLRHGQGTSFRTDGTTHLFKGTWQCDKPVTKAQTTTTTTASETGLGKETAGDGCQPTTRVDDGDDLWEELRVKRLKQIGHRNCADVYLGLDTYTSSNIIIKLTRKPMRGSFPLEKLASKVENEVSIMKKLHHRNIINFLGWRHDQGSFSIYMEYASGDSVKSVLYKEGAFSEARTRDVVRQVLSGLQHLHHKGIVYRDLKCENLLFAADDVVKIFDFGACEVVTSQIQGKPFAGTLNLMAPEVLLQIPYDYAADVWSLGCCVIEMLTGKLPFVGVELYQLSERVKENTLVVPIPEAISDAAKDFIRACTILDAAARPTAEQLLQHAWLREPTGAPGCAGARE